MNIKEAKKEIIHTLRAYHRKDARGNYVYPLVRQRPILLIGPPGIGKTAIMEQISQECNVGLVSYTITHHTRQSAIGLPAIVTRNYGGQPQSITEYTMSEIIASVYDCMERTGKKEGILFIDEINCVSETLAPTMLQFLQNKTFGTHKVPPGWLIVAAGNPAEYNKSVREFDIVTLDRVRKIEIEADCEIWMEYAWENDVHGAVLSYLNIKKDQFYTVENTADGKFFVTARGWEDLSEILKSYEALDIETGWELMIQYLQKEETARGFGAYYQLYRKYGTDYGIVELLQGKLSEESYQRKVRMAQQGAFEERFTVVGLVLDALNESLAVYENMDKYTAALHQRLGYLKTFLKGKEDMECLREFISSQKKSLEVKVQAELVSWKEEKEERDLIYELEAYDGKLREMHILDTAKGFEKIKEFFAAHTKARKEQIACTQKQLERGFGFIADCFGEEQEMVLFVSGLTRNERASKFIGEQGCDSYFYYSEKLLYQKQEEELRKECMEAIEELDSLGV